MKNLKSTQLEYYARQKALDFLRRHVATEEDYNAPDDEFIELHQSEYNTCMDLFIAGYRFADGLNDFESEFEYTHPD
jgi:hypothetical protein